MPTNESFSGVSNCYVFKSRLQEYAHKLGLPTLSYETIKEGPSHKPSFRSTVIVNDIRYDSLPGFFNRKAAEQSAAEVALLELSKSGDVKECISQPIHETGLCKNLLQEYAQKMNYAIPLYDCRRDEMPGRVPLFSCTVEIGGIRYIGAAAKTKKEAEIKAARTALLAIQSSTSDSSENAGHSQFTVIPCKKRGTESVNLSETVDAPKPKKARFKKKMAKKKLSRRKVGNIQVENTGTTEVNVVDQMGSEPAQTAASAIHTLGYELSTVGTMKNSQEQKFAVDGALAPLPPHVDVNLQNGQPTASNIIHDSIGTEEVGISSESYGDLSAFLSDANEVSGAGEVASMANNYSVGQFDSSSVVAGLNESGESIHPVSD